jgi:excisionase family DNA binding protein
MNLTSERTPQMKTVKEVSRLTGLPYSTLSKYVKQGKIPSIKSGRTSYINYAEILNYIESLPNIDLES